MVLGFVKLLTYLRIIKSYALIIRLCYDVFFKSLPFTTFFYLYNMLFAIQYYYIGVDTGGHPDPLHGDGNDYSRLSRFIAFFIWSYRTSLGDLETPNAAIWETALGDNSGFMVYLTWCVWMIHQFFLLIVFLNFFIANISQVYENELANTNLYEYLQKANMNLEAEQTLSFLGFVKIYEFFILTGAVDDVINDYTSDEWQGFIARIKHNQKHESALLGAKIERVESTVNSKIGAIDTRMGRLEEMQIKILSEIQSLKK